MEMEQDVTRRDFLKAAAVVTAASTLPAVGAPAIMADSSSAPVRYGFIGTGSRALDLMKALTTIPAGKCVATCDIYPVNLKKGVEAIGGNPRTYVNYKELLDQKDIDAVLIATPQNLHAQMLLDGLNAGKHVFVEKCMVFKEGEAEPVRQAAQAHPKQVLQVGLQRRSSQLYRVAMEMIRKGALGNLTFFRAQWHRNNNWRRPVVDAKLERQINWRLYREYSGGLMAELGSHQIDVINWALGAEPVSVMGNGGINHWKDGRETNDNVQVIFEYPKGQKLLYSSILCNAHYDYNEQIMGDGGTLVITIGHGMYYREKVAKVSNVSAKENWWAGATVTKQAAQEGMPIFVDQNNPDSGFIDRELGFAKRWLASIGIYNEEEPHDPNWSELNNFFASIRDGKPVAAPLEVGLADALAVVYANRAIDTGQKVYWPGQTQAA
ncbi:MAG TPA: Gfo/Idh/MocA family oxidoreductase [Terriglobia bacterium]|nr:Gfo/Idh/MocA family oxidoreductase [Terriglobia bacterium]